MRWPFRPKRVPIYWHEAYRPPLTGIEASGIHSRRSDFALWYLLDAGVVLDDDVRRPTPISFSELARVHSSDYIKSLFEAETLARIFAVEPSDVPVEALLETVRLACGGTLAAAQQAVRTSGPVVNLLGGFHHAAPARGGGFSALNDVAVAVAALRADGFSGDIAILDLDAHPPDGTSECLKGDAHVWIGSLSGKGWDGLAIAYERVLPEQCGDAEYMHHLEQLLVAMPSAKLAFVLAGGDVLRGDPLGHLGLSLDGARQRDRRAMRRLGKIPSVWLPGGGYHTDSWQVLAGTVLELLGKTRVRIPSTFNPLSSRYRRVAAKLEPQSLSYPQEMSTEDVEADLHIRPPRLSKVLGFYTAQGIEYALFQYGILSYLERLGYADFKVQMESTETGDRVQLFGDSQGIRHLLIETVVSRRRIGDAEYLFINWLTLRNPRAAFGPTRPQLPGQEVPGLGLAPEIGELLARIAAHLGLRGIVFRPAWFHLAVVASPRFRFLSPERQGRFEALARDLSALPLKAASEAVASGKVRMNGVPYQWEAEDMGFDLTSLAADNEHTALEKARVRFDVVP
jgi:acetoin utilization deacetylase AcuC-like enzyme